jgi:hypothetical protein
MRTKRQLAICSLLQDMTGEDDADRHAPRVRKLSVGSADEEECDGEDRVAPLARSSDGAALIQRLGGLVKGSVRVLADEREELTRIDKLAQPEVLSIVNDGRFRETCQTCGRNRHEALALR